MTEQELEILKRARNIAMQDAEKHAFEYARALDVGQERVDAFKIYENVRDVCRVY